MARIGARVLTCLVAALAAAPVARAGGDLVDVAAGGGRVWAVGPFGVRAFDARSGRLLASPRLAGGSVPLSVAVAGGAAWVASVQAGFVGGTLTRIDARTGRARVVWRGPESSVQYVAAGGGAVWALLGSRTGMRAARFTTAGRLVRAWPVAGAGRIAAGGDALWISTGRRLLELTAGGRLREAARAALGDVAFGAGAAWLPRATSVLRVDGRTGRRTSVVTGPLALGGYQHDLAAAAGALWAVRGTTLVRFDAATGLTAGAAPLPGRGQSIAVGRGALWVGTLGGPTGYQLVRLDPRTLRRTLLVPLI